MSSPYSRAALFRSLDGSIRCGAPRSCTYTYELREAPAEHAGGAGVVEVDVGEQERPRLHVSERRRAASRRRWTGPDPRSRRPARRRRSPGPAPMCITSIGLLTGLRPYNQGRERDGTPPAGARPAVGDAHLRRPFDRQGVERALPQEPREGPDRPVGGLRPAHADRLRPGPRAGPRRGRQGRRLDRAQGRHARAARRHPARRDEHVDDDQRHRGVAARPLHDRGRGERRRRARPSRAPPRTTSSRSSSPAAPTRSRPSPRCG